MRPLIPRVLAGLLAALAVTMASGQAVPEAAGSASASTATAPAATPALAGPPAGFVAPPEPKPDETNAQRAKSQPGNNAPFWRAVRESGVNKGTSSLPGAEQGVLVQPFVQYPGSRYTNAGDAWRQVRNEWIIPYGGALIVITVLAIALYFFTRGPLGGHEPDTGRQIERFTYFERAAHWSNAIAFCVLAISGLVMAFGKFILLPLTGTTLFGWLTYALKTAHNLLGPLFAVSLLIVFFTFLKDNFPNASDMQWLRKGGGLFGGKEPPSGRFNAGEKLIFWGGVFFLGVIVVVSGLVLDKVIPGMAYQRGDMQIAHMVHGVATALMMAMFLGHIYLGTLGMKDAFKAMKTGHVDEGWAKEHHELWYEDIRAGRIPARRTAPDDRPGQPAAQV
ncbi:formate dehydrogenase subunit gamma [Aquincola sp. S2]|uniref:Formate dehydrogenase subunit gamma n=1 Tax=Pseudaquabacterium terrae TaxID=2732868 RepID=A0ABX2EQI1_9BURK|nr:formate dehydrogenase subunit gamma [Aquabacterium terrae]NRF70734.1 formate dehydrogenase subunit gamma [Aquabacterium terrae]